MPQNRLSTKAPDDANAPTSKLRSISDSAHSDEIHQTQSRSYGSTTLHGESQAILGNVYHTYHHYHGSIDMRRGDHDSHPTSDHINPSLELSTTIDGISLDSISDYDPEWALWLRRADRLPDTCQWIFESKEYRYWQSSGGPSTLFCVGPVGCGKSMTASAVVDALALGGASSNGLVISYFVDTSQNQTPAARDMVRALIKQVVVFKQQNSMHLPKYLQDRLRIVLARTASHFALNAFIEIFKDLASHLMQCTIIIDGLDLLKEDDVTQCLQFLRSITSNTNSSQENLKTSIFCREIPGRGIRLENHASSVMLQISLEHIQRDIHHYIDQAVSKKRQGSNLIEDNSLITEIVEVLKANSGRMFLWAKLQVESIWNPNLTTSGSSVRAQLKNLPEDLDETYLFCLRRIEETNLVSSRAIAPMAFRWIASASRPLYPEEARELVSMDYIDEPITINDQLLSCRVIDYCANLVVCNNYSGRLEFTHPTVKSFLSDGSKIPQELKHFCLPNMDDMRCGHLCLIYLKQYRNQNQVAVIRKQRISPDMMSPIRKTVSESWPALRWLGRPTAEKQQAKNERYAHLSMPNIRKRNLSEADNAAHRYICNNWLWHTSQITQSHYEYQTFKDLCLCHNSEFQPWSESQRKGPDHYPRLIAHAVWAEHPPLLRIAMDETPHQVFREPCIGSDSSLLHVAAALGNVSIVQMLLPHIPDYADPEGKSAAAIAAECRQNMVLAAILEASSITRSSPFSTRALQTFRSGPPVYENLLNVCAATGNLEAIKIVLLYNKVSRGYLSDAVDEACRKAHVDVAVFLIKYSSETRLIGALQYALNTNDLELFDTFLALGASRAPETALLDVLKHFESSGRTVDPLIASVVLYQGPQFLPYRPSELCWLEIFVEQMTEVRWDGDQFYGRYLRIFLSNLKYEHTSSGPHKPIRTIPMKGSSRKTRIGISRRKIQDWLSIVCDDILVHILRQSWIAQDYLFSPECLEALANRRTSRALETLLEQASKVHWASPEYSLMECLMFPQIFLGRGNTNILVHSRKNRGIESDLHQLFQLHSEASKLPNRRYSRLDLTDDHEGPLAPSDPYLLATYDIVTDAARCFNHQTLEFFACTLCPEFTRRVTSPYPDMHYINQYYFKLHDALYVPSEHFDGIATLRWVRCVMLSKGNQISARKLYDELIEQGSSANFALNWPAGYTRRKLSESGRMTSFHTSILLGLYGWNFRLRRSKKRKFSDADNWYLVIRLYIELHKKIRFSRR